MPRDTWSKSLSWIWTAARQRESLKKKEDRDLSPAAIALLKNRGTGSSPPWGQLLLELSHKEGRGDLLTITSFLVLNRLLACLLPFTVCWCWEAIWNVGLGTFPFCSHSGTSPPSASWMLLLLTLARLTTPSGRAHRKTNHHQLFRISEEKEERSELLELLADPRPDVARNRDSGSSIFQVACRRKSVAILQILLSNPGIDVINRNEVFEIEAWSQWRSCSKSLHCKGTFGVT